VQDISITNWGFLDFCLEITWQSYWLRPFLWLLVSATWELLSSLRLSERLSAPATWQPALITEAIKSLLPGYQDTTCWTESSQSPAVAGLFLTNTAPQITTDTCSVEHGGARLAPADLQVSTQAPFLGACFILFIPNNFLSHFLRCYNFI